jgi:glucose/arabinose dehydrogenase
MKRLFLLLFAAAASWAGTPKEADFEDTLLVDGLDQPTCIAWAPDGSNRLFVSLKTSGIAVIENGVRRQALFATFPALYTNSECGVLGLAFDPDFTTNHFVYVFVTVSASEQRIVRFTDQASTGTQRTNIVTGLPTLGQNHDGGSLGFGPDGKIYWAIGDNGSKRGVDGNLTSLAAKVGRANKDGSVPVDNPFNDGSGPNNDYIWATGFRNPFTLTFRPATGDLWLNVVGSTPDGQTSPHTTDGYEQVFVIHRGDDGGYDDYEGNQPATPRYTTPFSRPCIRPVIQYKTDYKLFSLGENTLERSIASAQRTGGKLTVTTTNSHPYRVGEAVTLTNAGTLDGAYTIDTVPSGTTFTAPAPGANASANSGDIDELLQGGCITGGCFYDSSAFPAAYQGNFFYGDLNLGGILRAQIGTNGKPSKITHFVEDVSEPTDVAIGPDGALYYAAIGAGEIRRVAYTLAPGFIVSNTTLSMAEGGKATFAVRLGSLPTHDVTVQIHKTGAPADIDLVGSNSVTFTTADWDQPRTFTLAAAIDDDAIDDVAIFEVTAPGFDAVNVTATATDQGLPPLLVSTNNLDLTEGRAAFFTVTLPAEPAKTVLARVRPSSGPRGRAVVSRGALLRFTKTNWNVPHRVVLRGGQDLNRTDESVSFVVRAAGYLDREVSVAVHDNDPVRPTFTSTPKQQTVVGLAYTYTPEINGRPVATFELVAAPDGMTIDPATGQVDWTPPATGSFPVTIRATNRRGSSEQSFMLAVNADTAPVAYLISPQNDDTVTGANAEFFGGSLDDYGTFKAEFYIDGQLAYTDSNRQAHYHLNGAHNLFNTTVLSNGTHTLRMVVTDDASHTGETTVTVTVQND